MTKYGNDLEGLPELRPGEPFFFIRAQDALAPFAVREYAGLLRAAAAGADTALTRTWAIEAREQAEQVEATAARMIAWQATHGAKLPD